MEEKFTLKKLTVECIGVNCQYGIERIKDDDSVETAIYQKKDSRPPHLDLTRLFDKGLAEIVASLFRWDKIEGFNLNSICPTTIQLSGKDDRIGITISGIFVSGIAKMKFKTSKIKYKISDSEFAVKLAVFVEEIETEIQKYLFEDKTATVEEFGND